jgi:Mn-dependent DtxR family transcriptional regulator
LVKLTKKQQKLVRVLEGFTMIGQTPTHKEIAKVLGVTPPAVTVMLNNLEKRGAIQRGNGWRSIKLIETEF